MGLYGWAASHFLAGTPNIAQATTKTVGKAKSCIFIFAWGGPSQLDTLDPKPNAPEEIRGQFKPIATSIPGVQFSEHFPKLAKMADRLTVVRSLTHDDPAHLSSVHHLTTGRLAPKPKSDAEPPSRRDSPPLGSVLAQFRPVADGFPAFITLPWIVSHPAAPGGMAPGQHAGWLGTKFDPFVISGDPNHPQFEVRGLKPNQHLPETRMDTRRHLLAQLNGGAVQQMQQKGFDLLTSANVQRAFNIHEESPATRDRYGRNIHGQCLLMARRLVENGVRVVNINWHQDGKNFWDTHGDNFNRLKRDLMPPTDAGLTALLDDLAVRGMLDETLVVWVGEFGRKPEITRNNAGREHWPFCYSGLLAGGGIRAGYVHGSSDRFAAHPAENPVSPADLTATLYHAMGIPADTHLNDLQNRPVRITEGSVIHDLFQ
ncbi:MAG: DUF1501 domain-containing protein [Zavarzinella sp.]